MAFPNVFFHDMRPMAMEPLQRGEDGKAVPLEDLDLESFGTANYTDLTWRHLIDGWPHILCPMPRCLSCLRIW